MKDRLPSFPKTPHLPNATNMDEDDIVAQEVHMEESIVVEEKIDGASVGISIDDEGNPIIRNRDHILNKGYIKKNTVAKKQFRPIWNWFYDHRKKLEVILKEGPFSIYGEWMWVQHGIHYTRLPNWLIPYDIYNYEAKQFLSPVKSRHLLKDAGFYVPQLLYEGEAISQQKIKELIGKAEWSDGLMEGVYIKVHSEGWITHRYKMVREDFERGSLWDNKEIRKNNREY